MAQESKIDSMNLFDMLNVQPIDVKKVVGGKTCRTCIHRKRFALNEYSPKIIQCCEIKPSKRSNSGFVTIKVTDTACYAYAEETK
jgi:hypothetical protein